LGDGSRRGADGAGVADAQCASDLVGADRVAWRVEAVSDAERDADPEDEIATGRLDVMLDAAMNPWDCCALVPILREAGGAFTDWTGAARIDGGDAYSTNGRLHAAIGRHLAKAPLRR
jgi:hypothetical protein